ncbi:MAG TPA: DnaJ family domain-containing protein [Thermodesulfovibrionales bacterium]|jgi:hypothetical protein|nr:DnaJ family domain-containing protein [Thermodesulfovibrionales bacterium]
MEAIAKIAEERIRRAMENGEFDNLRGAGKSLSFHDETWVPEDLRPAYRILKNAGYLPEEMGMRKEIMNLRDLIQTIDDHEERLRKIRELNYKLLRFNEMRRRPFSVEDFPEYREKIYGKVIP